MVLAEIEDAQDNEGEVDGSMIKWNHLLFFISL